MVTRHDALQSVSKSGSCSKSGCREEGLSEDGFFFCEGDEPEAVGQACLQTVSSGDRSSLSAWVRDDHAAIPGFPHSGCMWYSGTAAGGKKNIRIRYRYARALQTGTAEIGKEAQDAV